MVSRPRCTIGIPAFGAISAQMSRERMARRQQSPSCWPVTVMKPKLRTDAPLACASRSITTTRLPRRAAARACASPQMPAPTMARSKTWSVTSRHPQSSAAMA
jgi:hypothetical protein